MRTTLPAWQKSARATLAKSLLDEFCRMGKFMDMKLEAWIESTGRTSASFARDLGVEASTIHRIVRRERKPSHALMEKIAQATEGAVTPNDFFDVPDTPDAAAPATSEAA
jgi:transcriptional regulator with XRE-family HTH domain